MEFSCIGYEITPENPQTEVLNELTFEWKFRKHIAIAYETYFQNYIITYLVEMEWTSCG